METSDNMSIAQLPSEPETLLIEAKFPATPARLFDYWTQPALLQQWWPQHAELQPEIGGAYHFSWPAMEWHLRGRYTTFAGGEQLAFTWKWDHDPPAEPARIVTLDFMPLPEGDTRLRLTHGSYAATPEDQAIRLEHHLAGWLHFLPRLRQVVATS